MTPVAIAAMFFGATIILGLATFGGVKLFELIEYRLAIRARLKLLNETLSDGTDGDRFVAPRDFKVLHGSGVNRE